MFRNGIWRERAAQILATMTLLLAGYAVGNITATVAKLIAG